MSSIAFFRSLWFFDVLLGRSRGNTCSRNNYVPLQFSFIFVEPRNSESMSISPNTNTWQKGEVGRVRKSETGIVVSVFVAGELLGRAATK